MPPTPPPLLQFACPQCVAVLTAPAAIAGKSCRCPRCQYVFVAPEHSRLPQAGESYALHEGEPSPPQNETEIPVFCSVCHTRMLGSLDQIGQTLLCPDCGTPAVVPSPSTEVRHTVHQAVDDIYPVYQEVDAAAIVPPSDEKNLIRVRCPRCDTIMYATKDQVGVSLTCPDCTTSVIVPSPSRQRPTIDVMADADGGYALADGEPSSEPPKPPPLPPKAPPSPDEEKFARSFEPYFRHPIVPRWPFLTGTFSFPFSSDTRPYSLLIGAWTALTMWLASEGIMLSSESDPRSILTGAILGALALMSTLMLLAYATSSALAIVRDTSEGCDAIPSWPGMAFIDWIGETFYVIIAFCTCFIVGMGVGWLLARYEQPNEAAIPLCLFFLFPFVLLSMAETCTPFGVFSWPVFRTLWRAGLGWAQFFIETAPLVIASGLLIVAALSAEPIWGILVAAPVVTYAWFVYFRLLGRLALYCTEHARKKDELDAMEW